MFVLIAAVLTVTALHGASSLDPDVGLNTLEMIANHGYVSETHYITTEDGYILTFHRIPHGQNDDGTAKRPAVLIMHGLASSSAEGVNMGPERSLGFILADIGYDVWLANGRGNVYSRNHTTIDITSDPEQFFNFTWHETGYYDVAAGIDYILAINGDTSLYYMAVSQGTTNFLALAATRPEYNDKIRVASLMAPVAFMEHMTDELLLELAQDIYDVEALLLENQIYELPFTEQIRELGPTFCVQPENYETCLGLLFRLGGADESQFDADKLPVILTNVPSNAGIRQFLHYGQLIRNGGFSQYDHGAERNLEIYGSETPPAYDLSKISAPVALYYGKQDDLADPTDVQSLIASLPNVADDYLVPYDLFTHDDFMVARDVVDLVYIQMIKVMQAY